MKKIIFIIFFFGLITLEAQPIALGIGGTYSSDMNRVAPNLRAYIFPNKHICIGPEISVFSKHKEVGEEGISKLLIEYNVTGHYIFELTKKLGIYPLMGLNFTTEQEIFLNETESTSAFGLNLGGGIHYNQGRFFPFIEYKYVVSSLDQHAISLGILYNLQKMDSH